jgi:hypothetical protein
MINLETAFQLPDDPSTKERAIAGAESFEAQFNDLIISDPDSISRIDVVLASRADLFLTDDSEESRRIEQAIENGPESYLDLLIVRQKEMMENMPDVSLAEFNKKTIRNLERIKSNLVNSSNSR